MPPSIPLHCGLYEQQKTAFPKEVKGGLKEISIVVPCYNEAEALPIFYKETVSVLQKMGVKYEFILVNDGSKDKTLSVMKDLAAQDENVFFFSFSLCKFCHMQKDCSKLHACPDTFSLTLTAYLIKHIIPVR